MSDDWRLMGQEACLESRTFRFAVWAPYRPGWDHDHCEFCTAEISDDYSGQADYNEAWVSADDNYTWVCPECFTDFHERFHWIAADGSAGPPERHR